MEIFLQIKIFFVDLYSYMLEKNSFGKSLDVIFQTCFENISSEIGIPKMSGRVV